MKPVSYFAALASLVAIGFPAFAEKSVAPEAPASSDAPADLKEAFEKADSNADGKLSPEEARAGGLFRAESFTGTDYDDDGTVTLFELLEAVSKSTDDWFAEHDRHDEDDDGHVDKNEAEFGSRIYTVFDQVDTNKDSRLDRQEIKDYAASSYYSDTAPYPIVPNIINKKF